MNNLCNAEVEKYLEISEKKGVSHSTWSPRLSDNHARLSAARARLDRDDQKKADMWSFAVLFWEMVTGRVPHDGVPPMLVGIKVKILVINKV